MVPCLPWQGAWKGTQPVHPQCWTHVQAKQYNCDPTSVFPQVSRKKWVWALQPKAPKEHFCTIRHPYVLVREKAKWYEDKFLHHGLYFEYCSLQNWKLSQSALFWFAKLVYHSLSARFLEQQTVYTANTSA